MARIVIFCCYDIYISNIEKGFMIDSVNKVGSVGVNSEIKTAPPKKNTAKNFVSDNKILVGAVGAAAITATVVGGILFHKSQKLTKEVERLCMQKIKWCENRKNDEAFTRFFDPDITINQIKEIQKLPKKERLKALNEFNSTFDRGLLVNLERDEKYLEKLPQNIQDAVKEKDYIKTKRLYVEYCDSLFNKSKTAGKTIAESVENVFGKGTIVKPHTYTPKENEVIVMNNYTGGGGYKTAIVTPQSEIASGLNWKAYEGLINGCYSHGVLGHMPKGNATPIIQAGKENGRHYVSISYGSEDSGIASYGFSLFSSKNGGMTQAQKDLLSIDTSKMSEDDINLLFKLPRDREKSNYDAVLSLVQTLAEKYKSVA